MLINIFQHGLSVSAALLAVNIYGTDPRTQLKDLMPYPWRWLGKVMQMSAERQVLERCTGVRISFDLVLTAAHCVGRGPDGALAPGVTTVFEGITYSGTAVEAWSGPWRTERDSRSGDWAVLRLAPGAATTAESTSTAIPAPEDYPLLAAHRPISGQRVFSAGYSSDIDAGAVATVDPACRIRAVLGDGTLQHDCATYAGASGGPLFELAGSPAAPAFRIVGIHNAHKSDGTPGLKLPEYQARHANLAASVGDLANVLAVAMAGPPVKAPSPAGVPKDATNPVSPSVTGRSAGVRIGGVLRRRTAGTTRSRGRSGAGTVGAAGAAGSA